jgi:hypothetical protein
MEGFVEQFYVYFSYLAAVLSVASVLVAYKAVKRGLTYSSMSATAMVLFFIAIGRLWHSFRETMNYEDWAELLEYSVYIAGNIGFIILALRAFKLKLPDDATPPGSGRVK